MDERAAAAIVVTGAAGGLERRSAARLRADGRTWVVAPDQCVAGRGRTAPARRLLTTTPWQRVSGWRSRTGTTGSPAWCASPEPCASTRWPRCRRDQERRRRPRSPAASSSQPAVLPAMPLRRGAVLSVAVSLSATRATGYRNGANYVRSGRRSADEIDCARERRIRDPGEEHRLRPIATAMLAPNAPRSSDHWSRMGASVNPQRSPVGLRAFTGDESAYITGQDDPRNGGSSCEDDTETSTLRPGAAQAPVRRVDNRVYTDPLACAKLERIPSRKTWLFACHESEVRNAGDYVTTTLIGSPLVVVRAAKTASWQGSLQYVRHRGRKSPGSRAATRPVSPSASSAFDFEGDLIGILAARPRTERGFAKADYLLVAALARSMPGLVFESTPRTTAHGWGPTSCARLDSARRASRSSSPTRTNFRVN